jgi:hypothetical protein
MPVTDLKRRATDTEEDDLMKLVRLESDVDHMKGALDNIAGRLEDHIEYNSKGFDELRSHMQKLAISSEVQSNTSKQQAETMSQLSNTIKEMAKNDTKISSLEEFRNRTDTHFVICDADRKALTTKVTLIEEKISRIYWICGVIIGLIEIISHLSEIAGHIVK